AGIPAVVYNGGVSGYSSNQELLKLIRDVLPLEPDIVVSLNGINDLSFRHSVPAHPMVHPYQRRLLESIVHEKSPRIFPNVVTMGRHFVERFVPNLNRIAGVNYGTYVVTQDHQQWARNVRLMHTISKEFGIAYMCFLQPTLGTGEYEPNPEDLKLMAEANQGHGMFLDRLESFYGEARHVAAESDYIEDFTDLFSGKTGLYRDARHPNAEGYALIARSIFNTLRNRGIFDTAALERVRRSYAESAARLQRKYAKGTAEPSLNSDATAPSGGEQREEFFGLSAPRVEGGAIVHRSSEDFFMSGWYIADSPHEVFAEIDGERYSARYTPRTDVEARYPEYKYRSGWIIRVPAERLAQDVTLVFYFGDEKYYNVRVKIPE
ncbi:MAG: SGNH/GDSL hydrolase family protein, partial [Candidatus Hydrogenedentes bacterium]|nr:SGNH/GDSL hydrolase family protein [Candidatus Hydrogenedentota bacterium]